MQVWLNTGQSINVNIKCWLVLPTWHSYINLEEEISVEELLHQTVLLWAYLLAIFLTTDWCKRTQPTGGSAHLSQVVLQEAEQATKQFSSIVLPWLPSMNNYDQDVKAK